MALIVNIPPIAGAAPTGAAGGDLGGTYPDPTVDLNTGLAGGQTVIGGTAASENLTLRSTSSATKGSIIVDSPIRDTSTPGTRIFSQTGTGTNQAYLILNEGSGGPATLGYTSQCFVSLVTSITMQGTFVAFQSTTAEIFRTSLNNNFLLGTSTDVASTKFRVLASKTVASASGAIWDGTDVIASTLTLSGSTNITTATGVNLAVFRAPTITAASALTVTNAATVAIAGPPAGAGAGPATITNAWSLWIQAGNLRIDGKLSVPTAQTQATIGANGAAAALTLQPVGYMKVDINGAAMIMPYYNP